MRQPNPCACALCESDILLHMSHVKFHFVLHASHSTLQIPHSTLHTSHCTLPTTNSTFHTSQSTLHTSQSTLHTSQSIFHTPHFTLHNPYFTLHTPYFTLHSPHFTLHTALFTPHTSHCNLHTPHFISSELFSPYPSSSLLIPSLLIYHLSFHESLPSITSQELACAVRQPGPCVCALCEALAVLLSKNMTRGPGTIQTLSSYFTLHSSHPTLHTCTSSQLISSELFSSHSMSSHMSWQQSSSWLFSCQILMSTTKAYKTTSQYYFVLQSLHKTRSSTT